MSVGTDERAHLADDSYNDRAKDHIYNINGINYKVLDTVSRPSGYHNARNLDCQPINRLLFRP